MSDTQTPFLVRPTECPNCKVKSSQRLIRKRAVLPIQKESDQHVTEYKWSSPKIQQVHPAFYFLHYCEKCHYTDTIEDFAEPDGNEYSRWTLKCHADALRTQDKAIDLIVSQINYEDIDFDSAIRIHYLATYIQLLSPSDVLDNYKIARLFLRIAWLYREQAAETGVHDSINGQLSDSNSRTSIVGAFDEQVQSAFGVSSKWDSMRTAIKRDLETRLDEEEIAFQSELDDVNEAIESMLQRLHIAKKAYIQHVTAEEESIGNREIDSDYALKDPAFLAKLKLVWPTAPETEVEAMRLAIRYFEKALSQDPRLDSMEAYFQVASLSVDLLMRCGDIDSAFAFVRGIHSNSMESRQNYTEKLRDPELTPERKRKLQAMLKRTTDSLECALDLRAELMNKLVERERPKIDSILKKSDAQHGKDAEAALVEGGIPIGLINFIKDTKNKHELAKILLAK